MEYTPPVPIRLLMVTEPPAGPELSTLTVLFVLEPFPTESTALTAKPYGLPLSTSGLSVVSIVER